MHIAMEQVSNGWVVKYVTDSGTINMSQVYTDTASMMKDLQAKIDKYGVVVK